MSGGLKYDTGKVPLELLPVEALIEIAKVMAFGAEKYGRHNWRKGMAWSRLVGAILRHLFAWMLEEDKDPESNLSHLAHAGCDILFLMSYELGGSGEDDRYKTVK